jgi:hypothetical protein
MRLHILSDLHLEFEPFTPPAVEADVVILAGGVGTGRNGLKWALRTFPDRPVIYVLGNHEFYGQKLQKLINALKALSQSGKSTPIVQVLDFAQRYTAAIRWEDFDLARADLQTTNAFMDANEAEDKGVRLVLPKGVI